MMLEGWKPQANYNCCSRLTFSSKAYFTTVTSRPIYSRRDLGKGAFTPRSLLSQQTNVKSESRSFSDASQPSHRNRPKQPIRT